MSILRNSRISALLLVFCLLLPVAAGCSSSGSTKYAENPVAGRETLTQVSTINALMAGVYDSTISCGQLKGYGDFGIGTFEALDGEMVVLNGQIYQVKSDGVAYPAPDSLGVPFAEVTFFDSDFEDSLASGTDYAAFQTLVDEITPSENIFLAVKIEGNFTHVETRSVPRQAKPYPALTDVIPQEQSVFEFGNVSGTIVGFWCPQYVNGVNVPGYHLHFLTADGKAGGHVLDFTIDQAVVSVDYTPEFLMILPGQGSDFYKIDLSGGNQSDVNQVEK